MRAMTFRRFLTTVPAMKGSVWRMLAAAGGVAALSTGVALAANTASFADPSGDADRSPDVTAVAITSDDAGTVAVKLTIANRSAFSADDVAGFGLDVDQNPDTGSYYYGAEYELDLLGAEATVLKSAPDGGFTQVAAPASFRATFAGGTATLTFRPSDFGVTSGFNLYAIGLDRDWIDVAPDIRTVNYQLVAGTAPPLLSPDRRAPVVAATPRARPGASPTIPGSPAPGAADRAFHFGIRASRFSPVAYGFGIIPAR